jgi:hypothetical protein
MAFGQMTSDIQPGSFSSIYKVQYGLMWFVHFEKRQLLV